MKILAALTAIIFYLAVAPGQLFAATLSLSPATGTFGKGCVFQAKVNLDTAGVDTAGTDAILLYTSSQLTVQSVTNGTVYPEYPGNVLNDPAGSTTISGYATSITQGYKGAGTFATVTFKVADTATPGPANVKFDFDPNDKSKSNDSNVIESSTVSDALNSVTNATYTIGSGSSCAPGTSTGGTTTGTGGTKNVGGTNDDASASAKPSSLPNTAVTGPTMALAIIGGILTIIGIAGLALL